MWGGGCREDTDGEVRLGYAGFEVSEMRGDDAFKL